MKEKLIHVLIDNRVTKDDEGNPGVMTTESKAVQQYLEDGWRVFAVHFGPNQSTPNTYLVQLRKDN